MLIVVMIFFAVHLGVLIGLEIWKPPKWLIPVQGLLEIVGCPLLVLIGVELLKTRRVCLKKDVIHVRGVNSCSTVSRFSSEREAKRETGYGIV